MSQAEKVRKQAQDRRNKLRKGETKTDTVFIELPCDTVKLVVPLPCDTLVPPVDIKIKPVVPVKKKQVKKQPRKKQRVQEEPKKVNKVTYKVKKGDTYYSISKRLNIPIDAVKKNNTLREGEVIEVIID